MSHNVKVQLSFKQRSESRRQKTDDRNRKQKSDCKFGVEKKLMNVEHRTSNIELRIMYTI
jgi:hypothetical protein